jgi:hypothetical protein
MFAHAIGVPVAASIEPVSPPPAASLSALRTPRGLPVSSNTISITASYARWQEPPAIVDDFRLALALL